MAQPEQRKAKRFDMRLAIELVRAGSAQMSKVSETRNVSSGGVLFTSEEHLPIGEAIEYFLTLPGSNGSDHVRLHCMGKVLRLEPYPNPNGNGKPFAVAATLERYQFVRLS